MAQTPRVGLILGQQTSTEVQFIANEIERQGHIPLLLDSTKLSKGITIEYDVDDNILLINFRGRKVSMNQISGVYWACVNPPLVSVCFSEKLTGEDSGIHHNILDDMVTEPNMDYSCLLQLLFSQSQVNWVNSFKAIRFHRIKPQQLRLARSLGASVAPTYVGNCPRAMFAFLRENPNAIIKPVFAGGHTKRLPVKLCTIDAIEKWAKYPVTLQKFIPGDNVRTYIIGQFMVSAIIDEIELDEDIHSRRSVNTASSLISDYRQAANVKLRRIELPLATAQLAMRIMRAFHMQYTAIDWRLDSLGEYYFLEANPAPLFVQAQHQLGVEIDRAIVDLMFA